MAPLFNINCNFDGKLIQKLLVAILGKKFITEDQAATTEALRHHELEMAQTEKDAERIKKGELDYTQNILVANHSSELPTINPQQELILREIVKDIVVREIQHRVNLNHVQRFALEAANEVPDSEVLDKEVDEDWWTRFRGYG